MHSNATIQQRHLQVRLLLITFATTMSKKANFSLDVKALAIELAPLLIPLLTQHIADSLKSLFSEQHEQLLSKMDQLIAATTSLSQAISTTVSAGPGSPMTSSALYSTVARVIHTDAAALVDKAKRCVFIGVPHETSKEATAKTDFSMVAEAVHASNNPDLINALDSGMISTHRHPNYDVSSGRTRPLKVAFPSQRLRDEFLSFVRFNKPSKIKALPHCYVRRDYCENELLEDRKLRQQAGTLNAQAKMLKYVVRDLRIVTLKTPRELLPRKILPTEFSDVIAS
ncbi:unnamed protein product [Toxocara canis]|uniref:Uncharacterized protein n=1 Tax=Toxocara canis TaxID=6265 RepID=A0A183TZ94_TOXCA|nr:unnamed protein product [Toxocara canis]